MFAHIEPHLETLSTIHLVSHKYAFIIVLDVQNTRKQIVESTYWANNRGCLNVFCYVFVCYVFVWYVLLLLCPKPVATRPKLPLLLAQ